MGCNFAAYRSFEAESPGPQMLCAPVEMFLETSGHRRLPSGKKLPLQRLCRGMNICIAALGLQVRRDVVPTH